MLPKRTHFDSSFFSDELARFVAVTILALRLTATRRTHKFDKKGNSKLLLGVELRHMTCARIHTRAENRHRGILSVARPEQSNGQDAHPLEADARDRQQTMRP